MHSKSSTAREAMRGKPMTGVEAGVEPLVADLRRLMADGRCLCSSAHTDWQGVDALLDHVEELEHQLAAARNALAACQEVRAKRAEGES